MHNFPVDYNIVDMYMFLANAVIFQGSSVTIGTVKKLINIILPTNILQLSD